MSGPSSFGGEMKWTCRVGIFLIVHCCVIPCLPQDAVQDPKLFDIESSERLQMLYESRQLAQKELIANSSAFAPQGIFDALGFHSYLIAIATIEAVQLPKDATSRTIVTLHVEQFLRGESNVIGFDVESRWNPKKEEPSIITDGNYRETALDKSEPKVGNTYILGYTLNYYGVEKFVFVLGVVDLQDSTQAELISNVRRFLNLESEAGWRGFETFLEALDDRLPWIRDIAVHRLTESDDCNGSPACAERFSAAVRRGLQSDAPNERQEAVNWLVWVDSVSKGEKKRKGYERGLPILPDSTLRVLFDSTIDDRNVAIGDCAFQYREMFKMDRSGSPGQCWVIVPALRKSARIRSQDSPPLPPGFPLSYSYGCVPSQ